MFKVYSHQKHILSKHTLQRTNVQKSVAKDGMKSDLRNKTQKVYLRVIRGFPHLLQFKDTTYTTWCTATSVSRPVEIKIFDG